MWQYVVIVVVVLFAIAASWREVHWYRYDIRHGTWYGTKPVHPSWYADSVARGRETYERNVREGKAAMERSTARGRATYERNIREYERNRGT